MWHEARKQEKKLRVMIVDYRKRAERRREFYEKFKADPTQFMQVHGRPSKIYLEPQIAASAENCMMPWQGNADNMIDRFDVRAHLDIIPECQSGGSGGGSSSKSVAAEEEEANPGINYERYRILIQNDLSGMSEDKFLHQIHLEEQFGTSATTHHHFAKSQQPKAPKAAIGYTYEDSTPAMQYTVPKATPAGVGGDAEEESEEEIDFDLLVNVDDLTHGQKAELNNYGTKYGLGIGDFMEYLNGDLEEKEKLRLAKLQEEEKQAMSGRKARRERRAYKDKLIMRKGYVSPPSYATYASISPKDADGDEDEDADDRKSTSHSGSRSRSASPEKITFITSFGGNESDDGGKGGKERRPLPFERSHPTSGGAGGAGGAGQVFGPALPLDKENLTKEKRHGVGGGGRSSRRRSRDRSRSPKRLSRRSRSRSNSRRRVTRRRSSSRGRGRRFSSTRRRRRRSSSTSSSSRSRSRSRSSSSPHHRHDSRRYQHSSRYSNSSRSSSRGRSSRKRGRHSRSRSRSRSSRPNHRSARGRSRSRSHSRRKRKSKSRSWSRGRRRRRASRSHSSGRKRKGSRNRRTKSRSRSSSRSSVQSSPPKSLTAKRKRSNSSSSSGPVVRESTKPKEVLNKSSPAIKESSVDSKSQPPLPTLSVSSEIAAKDLKEPSPPPPPPVRRYYGRRKGVEGRSGREGGGGGGSDDSSSSLSSSESSSDDGDRVPSSSSRQNGQNSSRRDANDGSQLPKGKSGLMSSASKDLDVVPPSGPSMSSGSSIFALASSSAALAKLTPKERLRRKMQSALSKTFRADKEAEKQRREKAYQERIEREESLRELTIKYRRREREKRHRDRDIRSSSSSSRSSGGGSRSRSRSPGLVEQPPLPEDRSPSPNSY